MKHRTPTQTAILLAIILKRSTQTRARLSARTIARRGGRKRLRHAFLLQVIDELAEFGWILFELNTGGFGAVRASTLEAAKTVTGRKYLSDDERRGRNIDWDELEREAMADDEEDQDGDDDE